MRALCHLKGTTISSEETSVVLIKVFNLKANEIPFDDDEDLDIACNDSDERSEKDLTIEESMVEIDTYV